MNAFRERREALLRAHMIDLDGISEDDAPVIGIPRTNPTDGGDIGNPISPAGKGVHTTHALCHPADAHERRVWVYALRIARGLPLRPGQRLTAEDRAELAKTQAHAPTEASPKGKAGRKSIASKTDRPFGERLNRDLRKLAERAAGRYAGGEVPMPAAVRDAFRGEPGLEQKWTEYVKALAGRAAGR